jgi:hypothetical protein
VHHVTLPGASRDEHEKVRRYVLKRLFVKTTILQKEDVGSVAKHVCTSRTGGRRLCDPTQPVILLTAWWIWKHGNTAVFDNARPSVALYGVLFALPWAWHKPSFYINESKHNRPAYMCSQRQTSKLARFKKKKRSRRSYPLKWGHLLMSSKLIAHISWIIKPHLTIMDKENISVQVITMARLRICKHKNGLNVQKGNREGKLCILLLLRKAML